MQPSPNAKKENKPINTQKRTALGAFSPNHETVKGDALCPSDPTRVWQCLCCWDPAESLFKGDLAYVRKVPPDSSWEIIFNLTY